MYEADLDQVLASARRIAEIRELRQKPAEIALPELGPLLTVATPDAVLSQVLLVVRDFGSEATELLKAVEHLAGDHPDLGVRLLAKSTAKAIRDEA